MQNKDLPHRRLFKVLQAFEGDGWVLVEDLVLLKLAVAAGGEVVALGDHPVLGDPEQAGELVDLLLERGDPLIEGGEFGFRGREERCGRVVRRFRRLTQIE